MTIPPLLLLASGRKPRLRRAPRPRPKELVLHCAVAKVLRDHARPEWLWCHIPAGEVRDIRIAVKLQRMGTKPGWPDFVLVSPWGSIRFLELKRIGETLSDAQEEFRIHCIRQGIPHAVAFTIDEALVALDHWQCLRIKIGGVR